MELRRQKGKEYHIGYLLTTVICVSIIGWFINTFPPLSFLYISVFLLLLGVSVFSFAYFFLQNKRRASLIAFSVVLLCILRMLNLRHPLYLILLFASVLSIDYIIRENF